MSRLLCGRSRRLKEIVYNLRKIAPNSRILASNCLQKAKKLKNHPEEFEPCVPPYLLDCVQGGGPGLGNQSVQHDEQDIST